MKKQRLDTLLVDRGCFPDVDAALRAVLAHEVKVDDVYATSAALLVASNADIVVKGRKRFVSRGGYKLQGALDAFNYDPAGQRCLDIGVSTGGFTDCLLQAGAVEVTCVDVGYGDLAWKLRQDPRVNLFERTNIKQTDPGEIGAPFNLIVIDVSFIGLAGLAATIARFAKPETTLIALIKPQFESRPGEAKGGIVQDEAVRQRTIEEVKAALASVGFTPESLIESPIKGAQGNTEYLVCATMKDERS